MQLSMLRMLFRENDFACRNYVNQQLCTTHNLEAAEASRSQSRRQGK